MNIRGFRYHPVDLETTVIRSHRFVTECAVFTWTKLLVVVAEIKGSETDALDLVPVITTALLEEQQVGNRGCKAVVLLVLDDSSQCHRPLKYCEVGIRFVMLILLRVKCFGQNVSNEVLCQLLTRQQHNVMLPCLREQLFAAECSYLMLLSLLSSSPSLLAGDCGHCGPGGPRQHPHQCQGGEAEDAPQGLLPQ